MENKSLGTLLTFLVLAASATAAYMLLKTASGLYGTKGFSSSWKTVPGIARGYESEKSNGIFEHGKLSYEYTLGSQKFLGKVETDFYMGSPYTSVHSGEINTGGYPVTVCINPDDPADSAVEFGWYSNGAIIPAIGAVLSALLFVFCLISLFIQTWAEIGRQQSRRRLPKRRRPPSKRRKK